MAQLAPTRRSQPYRQLGAFRRPGPVLQAMLSGRTRFGVNPMDIRRATMRQTRSKVSPLARLLLRL